MDGIRENAVPVHPAIPSKSASVKPIFRPIMNGKPLITALVSQKSATEHNAVDSLTPRSLRGMFRRIIPRIKKVTGTAAIGRSIFHSEKITATISGMQVTGATKTKMSPRSEMMVERCLSRCITNGLPLPALLVFARSRPKKAGFFGLYLICPESVHVAVRPRLHIRIRNTELCLRFFSGPEASDIYPFTAPDLNPFNVMLLFHRMRN
jgi:hypothetical protein